MPSKIATTFQDVLDFGSPWLALEPVRLGKVSTGLGTPCLYLTVTIDNAPFMRIDCYGDIDDVFVSHEAIVWQQFVAIGYGNKVYFVPLEHSQPATIGLGSYFAHLVPLTELLLVASGKRLFCIAPHGHLNGSTPPLAIDGVVIDKIDRQVIYGRGDWDPPGGWRPFQVDLSSGRLLSPP